MDSGTRRRLVLGLISNWISKLASTVIQLVQVPFFLHFWSTPVFGEWLIVNAIPSYLSFSNIGFGSVAGNEMTMAEARGDRAASLRVFQSCWWLIVLIMVLTGVAVAAAVFAVPVATLLNVHSISEHDTRWIIAYLGVAVLLGQFEQLLQSAYRSVGRYPYGSFIKSCLSLGAFAAMLVPVGMGYGPRTTALCLCVGQRAGDAAAGVAGAPRYPVASLRLAARAGERDWPASPAGAGVYGLSDGQRVESAGIDPGGEPGTGAGRGGGLCDRAHGLAGGSADGADDQQHV